MQTEFLVIPEQSIPGNGILVVLQYIAPAEYQHASARAAFSARCAYGRNPAVFTAPYPRDTAPSTGIFEWIDYRPCRSSLVSSKRTASAKPPAVLPFRHHR